MFKKIEFFRTYDPNQFEDAWQVVKTNQDDSFIKEIKDNYGNFDIITALAWCKEHHYIISHTAHRTGAEWTAYAPDQKPAPIRKDQPGSLAWLMAQDARH